MTITTQHYLRRTLPAACDGYDLRPVNVRTPEIFERPFADMAEVRGRLNLREDEIKVEIEALQLRWAFNFAPREDRNFLRIYKPAVEHWANPKVPVPATFDEFVRKLFPAATLRAGLAETISGRMFQEKFNLSPDNTTALLDARKILARDDHWGNGITPLILLPSVIEFLKARQLS